MGLTGFGVMRILDVVGRWTRTILMQRMHCLLIPVMGKCPPSWISMSEVLGTLISLMDSYVQTLVGLVVVLLVEWMLLVVLMRVE